MKKLLLILSLFVMSSVSFAQSPLALGQSQFNIGIGLSEWGVPFYAGFDYSAYRDITIGGEVSYHSYRENWKNNYYHHDIMGFSFNGNYHFNRILNLSRTFDFYAGLNIGYFRWSSPSGYDGVHNSDLGLGAQIGGRFYFTESVGINLEFGGRNAFAGGKFGLSMKL